jgi:TolA-binding protein
MTAMNRLLIVLLLPVWFVCQPAPGHADITDPQPDPTGGPETPVQQERATFLQGYELFEKKQYQTAGVHLYAYIANHSADDEDYDWALFFLGICLNEMGLSHAAVDTLSHLVVRKPNSKIVTYSLELLEHITRSKPFDWEQIVLNVLCDEQYDFVNDDLTDFVHYYQGLFDWEHNYISWGNEHFKKIQPDSYYHHKYQYQKALFRIYDNQLDEAANILEALVTNKTVHENIKDDARVTLGRIRYEQSLFNEADRTYRDIQKPNVEQAKYLLERAWNQYRLGNPETAMGLLYAFEAPSFWRHFTPEYYILKSFIYKDVCHYETALNVVKEFHERYGDSLDFIYDRGDVSENEDLLLVMLEKKRIKRLYRFLRLLEQEHATSTVFQDEALSNYLDKVYTLQIEETSRDLRKEIDAEYEELASELLQYEEEAHLLEYEIGLDMYQRASDYHYSKKPQKKARRATKMVAYPFQGEFWNDELDDYRVTLENKCTSLEEWDIFFK